MITADLYSALVDREGKYVYVFTTNPITSRLDLVIVLSTSNIAIIAIIVNYYCNGILPLNVCTNFLIVSFILTCSCIILILLCGNMQPYAAIYGYAIFVNQCDSDYCEP